MCAKYYELRCMFYKKLYSSKLARLLDTASKFALFSASGLKDKKLIKKSKQLYHFSESGKATDFKFGRYIYSVHPNKMPLKILEKRERGRI